MTTQLGLDGHEAPHPVPRPRPLTDRQREVLRFVRMSYPARPRDVGRLMHVGRQYERRIGCVCMAGEFCQYASSDGYDALRRLERRGLVVRAERGRWIPVEEPEDW